ncbi:MAG TPA: hypothetical protein VE623_14850 [Acidimicrobiales bacterium]|nr:hypothetical protein [Acidimicrobiales bacterium]
MAAPTALWPRQALEAALEGEVAGLETMRLLLAQPDWVHRRVDALEYRDSTTFRRRQSVHFTVPETAPELAIGQTTARLIPLTTLRKETLVNFDCRDESGTALPVLTRGQQGLLMVRAMTGWAEGMLGAPLDRDVAADIEALLSAGSGGDDDARDHIRNRLRTATDGQRAVLRADGLFPLMLDQFTDQFVLATLVHDPPGTQRIVKFSYEELGDLAPEPWPRAPLAALCWIPRHAASAAESLFSAESYHFEGDMPAGIDVPVASLWVGATEDDMACVDLDTGGHLRIALRAAGFERGVAEVRWSLRPARRGWLRTAWIATSLSALTLAVGAWRIDTITAGTPDAATRTQLAAAVILTLIGTLGGLVARIEEHPLVSRLLEWPRRLAGVAALLPFLAAGTLVVGPAGTSRRVLWALLAAMGVAIAGIFTVAFARPDTAADRPPPSGAGADGGG